MRFSFEPFRATKTHDAGHAPFVVCETCGKAIVGQQAGIVVFDVDEKRHTGGVRAIHKVRCETESTSPLPWDDLDAFILYLTRNTSINLEETATRLSSGTMGEANADGY
jgi:hypothetical protein